MSDLKDNAVKLSLRPFFILWSGQTLSLIGSNAVQSIARQPEAAAKIQVNMLITAAMIEGVALFGAVICLLGK